MTAPKPERWTALWARIGASGDPQSVWNDLERRYCEPHRAYHNFGHIGHCLVEFDGVRTLATAPDAVELAIWFHDAVYDTHAGDNEEQSALLAQRTLAEAGVPSDLIGQVEALVLATKHQTPQSSADNALLVDVDLAILGQPLERYAAFEREIRGEYSWVAPADFVAGCGAILRRFLERPSVYSTDMFRGRYERSARANLAWAIGELSNIR